MFREEDFLEIRKFIGDNRSSFRTWRAIPDEDELEKLRPHSDKIFVQHSSFFLLIFIRH